MEIRWMTHKNENGEIEKFYPATHAKAIVYDEDGSFATQNYVNEVKSNIENSLGDQVTFTLNGDVLTITSK